MWVLLGNKGYVVVKITYPAIEGVAIFAKVLGLRVGNHVFVFKPRSPDRIARRLGPIFVSY